MDQPLKPHQQTTTQHDDRADKISRTYSRAPSHPNEQNSESQSNSPPTPANQKDENEEDTNESSNLDGTTVADRPSFRWDSVVLDTWFYEIFALSFSITCFIAIYGVLRAYDQNPTPTIYRGLTLNTIVSILATASKSSLIFVVGNAIGQLRWISFQRDFKPVSQAQAYDSASRGPLGALLMLLQDKGRSLVTIGALITVLALLFDPFVQQVLTYPLRETPSNQNSAIAKRSVDINFRSSDIQVLEAINSAYWASNFTLEPLCPSGNCTWPSFVSVGFCSKCEDITASAKLVGCTDFDLEEFDKTGYRGEHAAPCNVSVPQGAWSSSPISLVDDTVFIPKDLIWKVDQFETAFDSDRNMVSPNKTFLGIKNPLHVFAHAALSFQFQNTTIDVGAHPNKKLKLRQVTQCALSLCTRTYKVSVSRGVSSTKVLDPDFGVSEFRQFGNDYRSCWLPSVALNISLKDQREASEGASYHSKKATESRKCLVHSPGGLTGSDTIELAGSRQSLFLKVSRDQWFQRLGQETISSQNVRKIIDSGLNKVMENMAASLTRLALTKSHDTIIGTMLISESYVAVHWLWLILPGFLLVLGIVCLVSTIVVGKSKELGIWKASILPFLYHGLDNDLINVDGQYATMSAMERSSKAVNVKLQYSDTRGGLVLGNNDDDQHLPHGR